jgi:hypothetical protein
MFCIMLFSEAASDQLTLPRLKVYERGKALGAEIRSTLVPETHHFRRKSQRPD